MKFIETGELESIRLTKTIEISEEYQDLLEEYLWPRLDDWQKQFIKGICERGITTRKQLDKYVDIVNTKLSKFVNTENSRTLSSILLEELYYENFENGL